MSYSQQDDTGGPRLPAPPPASAAEGGHLAVTGIAFNWLCYGLTFIFLAIGLSKMFVAQQPDEAALLPLSLFCALVSWVTGKALRYMLANEPGI